MSDAEKATWLACLWGMLNAGAVLMIFTSSLWLWTLLFGFALGVLVRFVLLMQDIDKRLERVGETSQ